MTNEYFKLNDSTKEKSKNIAYGLVGSTLSTIVLFGVNPILGLLSYALTGGVTFGKYIKDKSSTKDIVNDYFSDVEADDDLELIIDKKGRLQTDLPKYLSKPIQHYINTNGLTSDYNLIIRKNNNGKYNIGHKHSTCLGNYNFSNEFDIKPVKTYSNTRQNTQTNSGQNQSATNKKRLEALRRMRHVTPRPRRLGLGGAPGV
ncbi:MAG: hypothetical protein WC393_02305 [Candidatus Nanoarchaeia archaeon]|jgi:hypothetical protein